MVELIIFDIDGVITDGSIIIDENGTEQKKINLKDIDAIYELHSRGYKLVAITGESSSITKYFEKRFPWDYFYRGIKKKTEIIEKLSEQTGIDPENMCYIGDGKYDVAPLDFVGLGVCPSDAIDIAKSKAKVVLQHNGGNGGLWELISLLEKHDRKDDTFSFMLERFEEHNNLYKKMITDNDLMTVVRETCELTLATYKKGSKLLLCGNGGSAADAQHIATEFISRFYKERPALCAEALTVNTSTLTAVGNDYNFEHIFARQVEAKGSKGDLLIGISTSGKSKNVVNALAYGKSIGMATVILMGDFNDAHLVEIADLIIKVPSKVTPRIQESHIFIGHMIAEYVEDKMFNEDGE